MHLHTLYLKNFRNYQEAEVSFSPHSNLIYGKNAQGKTNLLEAVYLLSTGRSFRTTHLSELIRHSAPYFLLEAQFYKDGISQSISLYFDGQSKKMQYNNTSYPHFTNLFGLLPTVLHAPDDISLINGVPAERRRFLDILLAQQDPLYVYHMARFYKAMKNRNHLLKKKTMESITSWEMTMAISGSYITQKRSSTLLELKPRLIHHFHTLTLQKEEIEVEHQPSYKSFEGELRDLTAGFLKAFEKHRSREALLGSTLIGPHRDDFSIKINGQSAKSYASEGQKRCASLALRFAEWDILKENTSQSPILSIDDFGLHLDVHRQQQLQKHLSTLGQVFLTCPSFLEGHSLHPIAIDAGHVAV